MASSSSSIDNKSFNPQYTALVMGTLDLLKQADAEGIPIVWDDERKAYNGPEVKMIHLTIDGLNELNTRTKAVADKARDQLTALSHEQERLRIAASRPLGVPSEEEHSRFMEQNRQQLFMGYKKNSELEQTVTRLQAELARLQKESREEEQNGLDANAELNSDVLKLSIYRSLGFMPKEEQDGQIRGVIVRSQASQSIRTVQIDDNLNDFQCSNTLWQALAV